MAKYKDLYRAAELTADYEKLLAWQALARSAKQTLYKAHEKTTPRMNLRRVQGYIRIFGSPLGLVVITKKIPAITGQPSAEADASVLATDIITIVTSARASATVPTDPGVNILPVIKKFKFAQLKMIEVLGQVAATGRVLGAGYTKINTETVSTPFGRKDAAETYLSAVTAIKASAPYTAFLALSPPSGTLASNKIIIYPEAEAT